jgi:hypothetical protein
MRHDADGFLLEVGARTPTILSALRHALHHRDRGCRFPGLCGSVRAITSVTGQTAARRHQPCAAVPPTPSGRSRRGLPVERERDGELRFRRPDGCTIPEVPSASDVTTDLIATIRVHNEGSWLALPVRTATPGWFGKRLNVGWAIAVLSALN